MIVRFAPSFTFLLLLITNLATAIAIAIASDSYPTAKPGCKSRCGNVSVPFPFGIGANCSMNSWFEVSCNETSSPAATILLTKINLEVLNFSFDRDDFLLVKSPVISTNCSGRETSQGVDLTGSPFLYAERWNKFVAAGCNNRAFMEGIQPKIVGCESDCIGDTIFGNTCDNGTCCETVIPSGLKRFNARFESKEPARTSEGCKLAFLAQEEWLDKIKDPSALQNKTYVPAVFDWSIPMEAFEFRRSTREHYCETYSLHSLDFYPNNSIRCSCKYGYQGNPYLLNGCRDIDECQEETHKRCGGATCVNKPGTYTCERSKTWIIGLGIGVGFGVLCLVIGGWWLYKFIKKRREIKLKKKFFKRNGGLLLHQQMSSREGGVEKTKIFTSKELDKATDSFNKNRVLGQGGQGTVYKGMLVDGRIVAVKKSEVVDAEKVEEFINEVVIVSQINHRNVVKLLGCCLETEVPLLVYEFISNGTLFQYLHDQSEEFPLSWETRLRIAKETAEALSYLHSSASIPIYHRDIKSSNILLDEKFKAKVSDFGTSRTISIDRTHLTTNVQGTFGYLDPEYFQSSQFTDKSDVYSFGVVLVELLTGKKPISIERTEESRSLATHFILSMEENRLLEIVDARVMKQAKHEELMMLAKLAYRCLSLSGKKRPTMKEVAMQLERVLQLQKDSNVDQHNQEEIDCFKMGLACPWDSTFSSTGSVFDSRTTFSIEMEPLVSSETKRLK